MKKAIKTKRGLCSLLLALMLIMSACQTADGGKGEDPVKENLGASPMTLSGAEGRYVENQITLQDEIAVVTRGEKGDPVIFTKGLKHRYDSSDNGKSWELSDGPGKNTDELEGAREAYFSPDGTLYVIVGDYSDYFGSDSIKKISPGGKIEDFMPTELSEGIASGKSASVSAFKPLSDGNFYLSYQILDYSMLDMFGDADSDDTEEGTDDELLDDDDEAEGAESGGFFFSGGNEGNTAVYDAQLNEKYSISEDMYPTGIFSSEKELYLVDYTGEVQILDLENGTEIKRISGAPQDINSFSMSTSVIYDGYLYTLSAKGLSVKELETRETAQVIESGGYVFQNPTSFTNSFHVNEDGSFIASYYGEDRSIEVYRYEYDENAAVNPDKILNIWTLEENTMLRNSVSTFQKSHPDAEVNIKVILEDDSLQSPDDAIRYINTNILSGNGPDLLLLDGLSPDSYADKGLLLDLTDVLDTEGIYSNITQQMKRDGKLYYMPTRIKAPLLMGDPDVVENISSLSDLAGAIKAGNDPEDAEGDMFTPLAQSERLVVEYESFDELFDVMWKVCAGDVIDSQLDSGALKEFLDCLKTISDKYRLLENLDNEDNQVSMAVMTVGGVGGEALTGNPISYMSGRSMAGTFILSDIMHTSIISNEQSVSKPLPGLKGGSWLPSGVMGISAQSDKSDFALEFLQSMLSDETQSRFAGGGMPVSSEGTRLLIERYYKELNEDDDDFEISFDYDAFIEALEYPVFIDDQIREIIYDSALKYCRGEMEIDAVLSKVEEATKYYLAERE